MARSYHFVVVRKSDTGPRVRVLRGDGEPHVVGLRRVRPDDVVLALAGGHVAALRRRPLTVTVARRRRGHLLLRSVRRLRCIAGGGFRRLRFVNVRRFLFGFV